MTILIALHIILVALNGIIAGMWFGNRSPFLGLLHLGLMVLWLVILRMDFAL